MSEATVPESVDLAALEKLALSVARACGELITRERPADLGVAATKSSMTDVVTVMDRRSEELARTMLLQARPGDGFHGEEDGRVDSSTGITWVVDPIDGTVNYLYGIAAHAVSVAAVVGDPSVPGSWASIASAVVCPATQEAWSAHRGGGARLADSSGVRELRVNQTEDLSVCLLGTGFGYASEQRENQAKVMVEVLPRVRDIRRGGSAALDLCWVADGRLDLYYETGIHEWDLAGGALVALEAGAVLRGVGGRPVMDPATMAGPVALVEALDALLS